VGIEDIASGNTCTAQSTRRATQGTFFSPPNVTWLQPDDPWSAPSICTACLDIELRQSKYLNNIIGQDHRAVKRITDPMLGVKSFWSAQKWIAGIDTMHTVKKGPLRCPGGQTLSAAARRACPAGSRAD